MGTLQFLASGWLSRSSENSVTAPGLRRMVSGGQENGSGWRDVPIVQAHAFHTRTYTDLNHPDLDRVRDINTRLQAAAALSVHALDCRALREASRQRRGSEFRRAAARRKHGADGDVFDELGGKSGTFEEGLEGAEEEVSGRGVFETAPATFRERRSKSAGYHHIVRFFGYYRFASSWDVGFGGAEMRGDLGEALLS